jgi:hypothetical protein
MEGNLLIERDLKTHQIILKRKSILNSRVWDTHLDDKLVRNARRSFLESQNAGYLRGLRVAVGIECPSSNHPLSYSFV